jgi:hypothetical protein
LKPARPDAPRLSLHRGVTYPRYLTGDREPMTEDRIYYARRAAEERDAAARARTADARRRHLELAELLSARHEAAHATSL